MANGAALPAKRKRSASKQSSSTTPFQQNSELSEVKEATTQNRPQACKTSDWLIAEDRNQISVDHNEKGGDVIVAKLNVQA